MKSVWAQLKTRIFWRISAGLFTSILLIEVVLLVYSWFNERDRLLEGLDENLYTISASLDPANPIPQLNKLVSNLDGSTRYPVTGYVHVSLSGQRSAVGTSTTMDQQVSPQNPTRYNGSDSEYIRFFSIDPQLLPQNSQKLWLSVDTSWLSQYMQDYVLRILGMIVLISLFVTGACLIFLKPLLINPLMRLDRLLVRSQTLGIRNADAESLDLKRTDELGNVFRSFNLLRSQLVEAEANSKTTKRFEQFANMGAHCFWEVDTKYTFTYVTGDTQRVLSLSPEQVESKPFNWLLSELKDRVPDAHSIKSCLENSGFWEGSILPKANEPGKQLTVRIFSEAFLDSYGNVAGFRGTIKDVSTEVELARELTYQATHDELTQLYNRREFTIRFQQWIDTPDISGDGFHLLALDLDRFKYVNDTAGHAAGDALLKSISEKLTECVEKQDLVARVGGDEFLILIHPGCDRNRAKQIAEDIRSTIENYRLIWGTQTYSVSASLGLARFTEDLSTVEALSVAADTCCMASKQAGKNQLKVYGEDDISSLIIDGESTWVALILSALKYDRFTLFRQSIVRVDQTEEEHFEILLRMQNEEGGYYNPGDFLPAAERNHLMPRIDKWVIENAFDWLADQEIPAHSKYCVNVNLSAVSLSDNDFQDYLLDRVSKNTNYNHLICFEVTESYAIGNLKKTVALLKALKEYNCRIALDDFGTGFSSLLHIRELPLDYIKIDGVFIKDITNNELDQAVVKSVADIAKVFGVQTVAEYVESMETLKILQDLGIDYAQGFLFSKPEQLITPLNSNITLKAA